jgi:Cytochrome oxidase complex assembly protein 1
MKPKRPIGVTLLAVALLWIGFGSILLLVVSPLPVRDLFVEAAKFNPGFRLITRLSPFAFYFCLQLLDLAYGTVGIGLWKLRNWARRGVMGLSILAAIASLLFTLLSVQPTESASTALIAAVAPSAWLVWYLCRPRVRWAFAAGLHMQGNTSVSDQPPEMSRRGKIWTAIAIIATIALFVGSILSAVENNFRESEAYKTALTETGHSPCFITHVGTPLTTGWFTTGFINESNLDGEAHLSIPIRGPRGKGEIAVSAEKNKGTWVIKELTLIQSGREIPLLRTPSDMTCP